MRRSYLATGLLAFLAVRASALPPGLTVVAEPALPVAGVPIDAHYAGSSFAAPVADDAGQVLFASALTGALLPSPNPALHFGAPGGLQLAARGTETAPGTGLAYGSAMFDGLVARPGGRIAFAGSVEGASAADDEATWVGTATSLGVLVREGMLDPATGGAFAGTGSGLPAVALNSAGTAAMRQNLGGPGILLTDDQAIYTGVPGALALVAREGQAAPGAFGASFASFPAATAGADAFSAPSVNGPGTVLFRANLAGAGITIADRQGVWIGAAGALGVAARGGDQAPALPLGQTFFDFTEAVLNDAGQIAIAARTRDATGATIVGGVWTGIPGGLTAAALENAPATNDPLGVTFGTCSMVRMNGSGRVAFKASIFSVTENRVVDRVYAGTTGNLKLLARTNRTAPGLPPGVVVASAPLELFLNGAGTVAFRATLSDGGTAIFTSDVSSGVTQLLVRTGAPYDVDGFQRTPTALALYSGPNAGDPQDGRASPLSESGDVAFLATFADGATAIVRTGTGGGAGPCPDAGTCLARLALVLPDPLGAADAKSAKAAKQLAALLAKAQAALTKAATLTGRKQAKQYAAARTALTRLLAKAAAADAKGRLGTPLAPIARIGEETIALVP